MLNRRTLRIKAMQSIFAFEQCKEANYHLAIEQITNIFQPDLNSMEVQDKAFLKAQREEAIKLFKDHYRDKILKVKEGSDNKINETVTKAIKEYYLNLKKDSKFLKKEMLKDAEMIYNRYSWLLYWVEALITLLKNLKSKPGVSAYTNLINNQVINILLANKKLSTIYIKSGLNWDNQADEQLVWLKEVLLKDEEVINYLDNNAPTFDDDKAIILHIYKACIFKHEIITSFMENQDLYWSENKAILRSMVVKTIKGINEGEADFILAELSYNWQEDKQFFETIFDKTVHESEEYEKLIDNKTKNWDIERISDTDRILLQMAIQEMINFSGIPLKVTINEYIEVSKKYSTPKSKQFINGVLDVIAVDLQKKGVIKKSGRGLIDNK